MRIKQILIKKKTYDLYSEIVAYIAAIFVKLFIFLRLTPNMVSFLGILCVLGSAVSFAFNLNFLAVFLLYFGLVMDFADGILARCTGKVTKYQAVYLERIYHELAYAFLFIGIGFGTGPIGILFGFICAISILCTSYLFQLKNWILSSFANQDVKEDNFNDIGMNKTRRKLFNIASIPTKYIKSILFFAVIINATISDYTLAILLILYTKYLILRFPAYLYLNYKTLGGFEKCVQ